MYNNVTVDLLSDSCPIRHKAARSLHAGGEQDGSCRRVVTSLCEHQRTRSRSDETEGDTRPNPNPKMKLTYSEHYAGVELHPLTRRCRPHTRCHSLSGQVQ